MHMYMTCTCSSVEHHYKKRAYVLLDEQLTWDEANDRCKEGDNAYLAVANDYKIFKFLRGMYDEYVANGGSANGVWIDGKYYPLTDTWQCDSNSNNNVYEYEDICQYDMPWSHREPNRLDTEHCILVWYSRRDGVANYRCNARMPAICATKRYVLLLLYGPSTLSLTRELVRVF